MWDPLQPVRDLYYFIYRKFAMALVPLCATPEGRRTVIVNLIIPCMLWRYFF